MKSNTIKFKENKQQLMHGGKAYDNGEFIHSRDGRTIRILSEYLYPEQYFNKHEIKNAIVFYGSARTMPLDVWESKMTNLKRKLEQTTNESEKGPIVAEIEQLEKIKFLSEVYQEAVETARMMAEWAESLPKNKRIYVCTGGGPGMMEAANRGAYLAQSPSIGLNISLPFEQTPNNYISGELNFEFHYFFMRKFWFSYLAAAMVALPGGFGTMDELFEILTLRQTKKVTRPMPIVLYSSKFWKSFINFDYLVDIKMINKSDLDLFKFCDTPQEAFDHLTTELTRIHKL